MSTNLPRLTLTLNPDWMPELDNLKREKFLNEPRADVIRYLIELGLREWNKQKSNSKVG